MGWINYIVQSVKKMNNEQYKGIQKSIFISTMTTILFIGIIIIIFTIGIKKPNINQELIIDGNTIDAILKVNCSSNSMGLGIRCNDRVYSNKVNNDDELFEGNIYAFKNSDNNTVVHRLVKDCTNGCYGYIFKGDNNLVADKVINKSDIKYKIISVKYS